MGDLIVTHCHRLPAAWAGQQTTQGQRILCTMRSGVLPVWQLKVVMHAADVAHPGALRPEGCVFCCATLLYFAAGQVPGQQDNSYPWHAHIVRQQDDLWALSWPLGPFDGRLLARSNETQHPQGIRLCCFPVGFMSAGSNGLVITQAWPQWTTVAPCQPICQLMLPRLYVEAYRRRCTLLPQFCL